MFKTFRDAMKVKDIRKRLFYTFIMLIVVRLGSQLPVPFVDRDQVSGITDQFTKGAFSFFDAITGGSMESFSLFALSITPYITSSIIMQLLTIAIPRLEELQKDGEDGRKKIAEFTRYVTVILALIEGSAISIGFGNQRLFGNRSDMSRVHYIGVVVTAIAALVAGSAVLMWIGEQITDKGVGNGISIVLLINIVSRIPQDITNLYQKFVGGASSIGGKVTAGVVIIAVIIAMVVMIVVLQDAERRIAVQYSKKVQGRRMVGGNNSYIPLKVNTAGVIPIIFASSLLQFPVVIASFLGKKGSWTNYLTSNEWCKPAHPEYSIGFVVYIILCVLFAYFYTSITFNPLEIADNMKKQGGFIPGIRPGNPTVQYLQNLLNYIIFIGAVGLIIVAAVPIVITGLTSAQISFGGTSMIIIVGVVLETIKMIESMMVVRNYKGFLDL
ncbi:preprotein translocase subunit SecY [uncultured Eubacterium sp.]|uniref:preprotein translocase subunit SecY n=1 Tax=uncultured Eubacterium sp. TaxID=165185 RepID=UPI000E9B370A|nr:preprotein translocase subunit SecY [uncultured Eubacterium sp.]HAH17428.1 preprotein translocase subunit SecY [Eubacterium sp.]HAV90971.1 preprotein translocase subunit SecY [Eubacterium sp.]